MRKINNIVVHCSATEQGKDFNSKDIAGWHKSRGFKEIGYHYVILLNGDIENGRDIFKVGAGVFGHNKDTIHVCYVGGLDSKGKAKDTRTEDQKHSLLILLESLKLVFNQAEIVGHRDLSPDKNKDGKITKNEFIKACPCYDAINEYKNL